MTLVPCPDRGQQDTPACRPAPTARLASRWHKLTSPDEFRRRTDALGGLGLPGRVVLQASGAWLQLWVGHSWADGTIPLTPAQAAGAVGASAKTWRELSDVLAAAGLLEQHGEHYRVPDPAVLEGFALEHRGAAGFRSLHRAAFHEQAVLRAALHAGQGRAAAGKRRAVLGVLAWVVLRHTSPLGTRVSRQARAELDELLDRDTARNYLGCLEGLLTRGARGHLTYVGRSLLEGAGRPDRLTSVVAGPANETGSARHPSRVAEDACAPETGSRTRTTTVENPDAGASSRSRDHEQLPPNPQPEPTRALTPPRGDKPRHPLLDDLVNELERWEPRLRRLRRRPQALQALSDALGMLDGDRAGLLAQLRAGGPLTTATYPVPALIRCRLPAAVNELRAGAVRRTEAAEHAAWRRQQHAATRATREHVAAAAEQAAAEVEHAAGGDWERLVQAVALRTGLTTCGPAAQGTARAAVRAVAERRSRSLRAATHEGRPPNRLDVLRQAVQAVLAGAA